MTLKQQLAAANKRIKQLEARIRQQVQTWDGVHPPVRWIDSRIVFGWEQKGEQTVTPVEIKTVGYVYGETEEAIALASSQSMDGGFAGIMVIPRVCIIE